MRGAPGGARLREAEGTFSFRFFPVHGNVLFLHFVEVQYIGNSKGRKENPTVVR